MIEKKLEIVNKLGLHLRAVALLVQTASRYKAEIEIRKDRQIVDAKSIMGLMSLAASHGSKITLRCKGKDEQEAVLAIAAIVANKFGEGS